MTWLGEMRAKTFGGTDLVTIGESRNVTLDNVLDLCGETGPSTWCSSSPTCSPAGTPNTASGQARPVDPAVLNACLFAWQRRLADEGWESLFLSITTCPAGLENNGDTEHTASARPGRWSPMLHLSEGHALRLTRAKEIRMKNIRFDRLDHSDLEPCAP